MSDLDDDIIRTTFNDPDSDDTATENLKALSLAISDIIENIVRKELHAALPSLLKPLMEQSLKGLVHQSLPGLVETALPRLADERFQTMIPPLVESAIAEDQELIKETAEDVARHALPGLIGPILERLSKETIQQEVRKTMDTTGHEIVEKVAWEVVPVHAEIEVRREIERLTAED
jgi:hypothetical protein